MSAFHGRFLVHATAHEVLEGTWPGHVVMIGFPDIDAANGWWGSPAYQAIAPLRTRHIEGSHILCRGRGRAVRREGRRDGREGCCGVNRCSGRGGRGRQDAPVSVEVRARTTGTCPRWWTCCGTSSQGPRIPCATRCPFPPRRSCTPTTPMQPGPRRSMVGRRGTCAGPPGTPTRRWSGPAPRRTGAPSTSSGGCPRSTSAVSARGLGLGRRLLGTAVADLRAAGRRPCLEAYPARPAAMALYASEGWREAMRTRPEWLRAVRGRRGSRRTGPGAARPSCWSSQSSFLP